MVLRAKDPITKIIRFLSFHSRGLVCESKETFYEFCEKIYPHAKVFFYKYLINNWNGKRV